MTTEGSGLGLALCSEIVKRHQSELLAFNNDIGGLTLCFSIRKEK